MEDFALRIQKVMLNDRTQPWALVQQTDYPKCCEWHQSSIFKRNSLFNDATVSTKILLIHKSGQAFISEHTYEHEMGWLRRFASTVFSCGLKGPEFRVKNHVKYFFEV